MKKHLSIPWNSMGLNLVFNKLSTIIKISNVLLYLSAFAEY